LDLNLQRLLALPAKYAMKLPHRPRIRGRRLRAIETDIVVLFVGRDQQGYRMVRQTIA
jgi:hypothetical protein